jgi:DNA-binding protein HU-beta
MAGNRAVVRFPVATAIPRWYNDPQSAVAPFARNGMYDRGKPERMRPRTPRNASACPVTNRGFHPGVPSMNKAELIDAVAEGSELTKADAGRAVDAVIAAITKALKKGDTVTVVGFGTFAVRKRAAREGRNPRTGETIKVAASMNPAFKAGKALKDAVN